MINIARAAKRTYYGQNQVMAQAEPRERVLPLRGLSWNWFYDAYTESCRLVYSGVGEWVGLSPTFLLRFSVLLRILRSRWIWCISPSGLTQLLDTPES